MISIYRQAFGNLPRLLKERFNFETEIKFEFDLDYGLNLLEKKKITLDK